MTHRPVLPVTVVGLATALMLGGCAAGEGSSTTGQATAAAVSAGTWSSDTLDLDFATYNPLSLIIKEQGWLEQTLGEDVTVTWTQSAGSNKANEALRAGAIDVGSTAGSAALLARANGSPIRTIDVYTQPEWSAIVVAKDSPLTSITDLAGHSVAATKGTDPYFFLLQALDANGLDLGDVEVQNLQHADGRVALENGSVDAWAGLDPIMADSEVNAGSRLIFRDVAFNSYGFLNAREEFLDEHPDLAQLVVDAYEKARAWAVADPEGTAEILAQVAGIDPAIARTVILERTTLDLDPVPGEAQRAVLATIGPVFVESGDVSTQEQIDEALDTLFDGAYASTADPSRIAD